MCQKNIKQSNNHTFKKRLKNNLNKRAYTIEKLTVKQTEQTHVQKQAKQTFTTHIQKHKKKHVT